jgi:hypothetical protein
MSVQNDTPRVEAWSGERLFLTVNRVNLAPTSAFGTTRNLIRDGLMEVTHSDDPGPAPVPELGNAITVAAGVPTAGKWASRSN